MDQLTYKNMNIEFEESSNPKISIDGNAIQVSQDIEAESFNAAELPYHTYTSVTKLAEAIVDQRLQRP